MSLNPRIQIFSFPLNFSFPYLQQLVNGKRPEYLENIEFHFPDQKVLIQNLNHSLICRCHFKSPDGIAGSDYPHYTGGNPPQVTYSQMLPCPVSHLTAGVMVPGRGAINS